VYFLLTTLIIGTSFILLSNRNTESGLEIVVIDDTQDNQLTNDVQPESDESDLVDALPAAEPEPEPQTVLDFGSKIIITPTVSKNSAPKGKVDIYWKYRHPDELERGYRPGPFVGIASPLDLVSSIDIQNNSTETLFLRGIKNENADHIDIPQREIERATPLMLLPDTALVGGVEVTCVDRDTMNWLRYPDTYANPRWDNICNFDSPIEIQPGETLKVTPTPYLVNYGKTGEALFNPFPAPKTSKKYIINTSTDGSETYWIPKRFFKYDDVLKDESPNVGGYFIVNLEDPGTLNSIMILENEGGDLVHGAIGNPLEGSLLVPYDIPRATSTITELSTIQKRGLIAFLHINGFLNDTNLNVVNDKSLKDLFSEFQNNARVAVTEKLDELTLRAMRSYKADLRFYENYEDSEIRIALDTNKNRFTYWAIGTADVKLDSHEDAPRTIESYELGQEYPKLVFSSGDSTGSAYSSLTLVNNTIFNQVCLITSSKGPSLDQFTITPNTEHRMEIGKFINQVAEIDELTTSLTLVCGDKTLRINKTN